MTNLDPTPNAAFWQALEAYIRDRIVEQVAEKPAPEPEAKSDKCSTCGHHDTWHNQFGGCFCGCKDNPAPKPVCEEDGDEAWQEYQYIKQSIFPVEEQE